jgi:hypothetical protein
MNPTSWPWSPEEEQEWQKELIQMEFGWMEATIDHLANNALAGYAYDPLRAEETLEEEKVFSHE